MDKSIEKFLKQSRRIVRDWCTGDISTTDASSQILSLVPDIDDYWLSSAKEYATKLSNDKLSTRSQKSILRMLVLTMQDYAVSSGWEEARSILYCVYEPANRTDRTMDAYSVSTQVVSGEAVVNTSHPELKKAFEEIIYNSTVDINNDECLEELAKNIPENISGFKRLSLELEKHIIQPWCPDIW